MDNRSRRSRWPRPTPSAWRLGFLGFGLLAAAVNTGNNLIYLLFSLLTAALPVSYAFAVINARRLRFDLHPPRAPQVGAPFTLDVTLRNDRKKLAARGLEITLQTDQGELGPAFVERVGPGETARVTLLGRGRRRGPLQLIGATVRSTFPLGLVERTKHFRHDDEILILPATTRGLPADTTASHHTGSSHLSPRVVGTEYHGLRRGAAEDDARKVDWKVTARRGVLMVRETAGEGRLEVDLEVATRRSGEPDEARLQFERQASAIAGRGLETLRDGGVVRLTVDDEAPVRYSGRNGLLRLLGQLARLEPTGPTGANLPRAPLVQDPSGSTVEPPEPRSTISGRLHRYSALAAMAVSLTTLFVCGGMHPVAFGLIGLSLLVTARSDRLIAREGSIVARAWRITAVVALVLFLSDVFLVRRNLLLASSALLVYITLYTLHNARRVEDDRRLLLLSFLYIVLSSALTTEVALALPLLAWLMAAGHALMSATGLPDPRRTHRRRVLMDTHAGRLRYLGPTAACVAAVCAAGVVVFLVIPHFGTGTFRPDVFQANSVSGFTDTARLGDIGLIKLDESKVMQVTVSGPRVSDAELKWRGLALNRFDGRTWTRRYSDFRRLVADRDGRIDLPGGSAGASSSAILTQKIRHEPTESNVLFAAGLPTFLDSTDFRLVGQDGDDNLELRRNPARRFSYDVASVMPPRDPDLLRRAAGDDPKLVREFNLVLPKVDERIEPLARRITAGATTRYDAVQAIEGWLGRNHTYSLDVRDVGAEDPLARFLFEGMPGHCEYFATAMVVLSRSVEIPTRYVTGYLRGEKSRFGRRYQVRQSDAHAWVEVYFPQIGWVPFDPTPPAGRGVRLAPGVADLATYLYSSIERIWDDYLIGIDLDDQVRGLAAALAAATDAAREVRYALSRVASWGVLGWSVLVATLGLVGFARHRGLLRWRRRPSQAGEAVSRRAVPGFYRQVLDLLAGKGLVRRPGETPSEFAERVEERLGGHASERMRELTGLYYRVRFDPATDERHVGRIARALVGDMRESLRPR